MKDDELGTFARELFNQKLQKTAGPGNSTDALVFGGVSVQFAHRGGVLLSVKLFAFELDLLLFFLTGFLQSALANELDDRAKLIAIEPGAVAFANIDNYSGAARKIDPVHQLITLGAGYIANLIFAAG